MVRQLRAVLVALHLAVVTFVALPSAGGGMNRSAWKAPTVQGEFRAWSERLAGLGIAIPPDRLEDRAWAFASAYEGARSVVLRPLIPYLRYCGTWQSWRMFVAPHRYPSRLEIEVADTPGAWRLVYAARSAEHDWMRGWLDHDRLRAAVFRYAWDHYKGARKQFVDWVARQAAVAYPDAREVRVSFVRYKTPTPAETRSGVVPAETRELAQVRELGPLR